MAAEKALRITFIGINYTPEPTGIAPYTGGMARALQRRGHEVRVVTGYPHYPAWQFMDGYDGRRMSEVVEGVSVERRRHVLPRGDSIVRRAAMEVDFGLRSILAPWGRPDVVVLVSPALLSARAAAVRARLRGIPTVTWVQDIYTLGLVETGGSRRAQRLVRAVEGSLLRGSSRVVVIHERFRDRLRADLRVHTPIDVVRNWSHVDAPATSRREEVRRRHGWAPADTVVLHAGNMGAKQGLENVIDAARLASDRHSRVRFVLLGDGNQRAALETRGSGARLQFVDPLPDGDFEETLAAADVLLVNELPGLTEMSVPSKLTTYYATGLPVLASVGAGSTTAAEVELSGAGEVVEAGEPATLLRAAEQLGQDPERAERLGAAGRAFRRDRLSESGAVETFEQTLRTALGQQGRA